MSFDVEKNFLAIWIVLPPTTSLVVNRRVKVIQWKRNFHYALIAALEKEK